MNCKIKFERLDRKRDESLNDYHERAYLIFKKSLIINEVSFRGLPVKVRELPIEDNKVQGFFHVISEQDKKSKIRLYKEERVKYIPLISKMITEYNKCDSCTEKCTKIKIWSAPFLGKESIQRVKIYFEELNYIVILEKRNNYYQLVTAYVVDNMKRHEKLINEYKKYTS